MEIVKLLKIGLVVVVILIVLARLIAKVRNRKGPFLDLNVVDDHPDTLVPGIERPKLMDLLEKHEDTSSSTDNNLIYSLSEMLLDPLSKLIQQPTEAEYFKRLNKPQRVFSLAMQFDGQVNNGGVYQFLWNRPFSMYAMKEALRELDIEPLSTDYASVLLELERNADDFSNDKKHWNNPGIPESAKWERFQEGRKYIPTGAKIEAYFYDEAFKWRWHRAITNYVKRNLNYFIAN